MKTISLCEREAFCGYIEMCRRAAFWSADGVSREDNANPQLILW